MDRVCWIFGLLTLCSCGGGQPQHTTGPGEAGFDPTSLAADTRPQDDFFDFVNGPWLARTPIPEEYSRYGTMQLLTRRTEDQIHTVVTEMQAMEPATAGSDRQKITDLFSGYMDEARANELGLAPLADQFARVNALQTHADVVEWFGTALAAGITVPINFYIDSDADDPGRALAYLWQDGLGLPDRDYWLSDTEKLRAARGAYVAHIERMYALAGWDDGAGAAAKIAALEKRIATAHWTRVRSRDRETIYSNKFTLAEAESLDPEFDWITFLDAAGFGRPTTFVIAQTDYFAALGEIINSTPVDSWREYARFRTLKAFAPYLNDKIVAENFAFELRTLRGQQQMKPRWKRGIGLLNASVGELVGKAYVKRYFPPEAKQRVETMIENLREAFRVSIGRLDWMSDETKLAALDKLAAFRAKIGYPDTWRDYSSLEIIPGDLVGNVRRAAEFEHQRQIAKLGKPVDRSEWTMAPQIVNASYRATWNEILFPAAILQPPFFDFDVDDAFNYGAIGAVIGHEFSHGFDDQGRKFDGAGRLHDWWTPEDAEKYEVRTDGLVAQYDAFEVIPGHHINGDLTLGENIADLAGVIMAYRAWQYSLDGAESPVIDGFTGAERFFIGFGTVWRSKETEEYLVNMLVADPHSPPRYRVIGTLKNVPAFYRSYDVSPGDTMFLPPDERVSIW